MSPFIRPATKHDADGISRVHIDSWRTTYRGIVPDKFLDEMDYEARAANRRKRMENPDPKIEFFVVEDPVSKKILGFASGGPLRDGHQDYDGELYAIYLYKENQRQGIGKELFLATARWLREQGYKSLLVWVLKDNHSSRKFYEALGGQELESKTIEIGDTPLEEVSYGWPDLRSITET